LYGSRGREPMGALGVMTQATSKCRGHGADLISR